MQDLILYIVLTLVCMIVFLLLKQEKKKDENGNKEEIEKLKESFNNSINTMSGSINSLSKDVTRDMTQALTKVDEKVGVFNQQVQEINKSQNSFSRILSGVKQYGVLAEFSLAALLKDLLPAAQYIANVKMKPEETNDVVEFAVKLQNDILCPIDSHWPIEKYKAIDDAFQAKDKDLLANARNDLASAFRVKSKSVSIKYINPPKSVDFAIVYAPTEGLYAELASYRDPKTKELLLEEIRKKYKITIAGPNTLCAILQAYHLGFQTLKVQKHATQIHDDLKIITTRFTKHFDSIKILRKKLEDAMKTTDDFGRDARSIMRTLENIKDPEQVEKAIEENNNKIKILNK
ncbi:MAG: DNA recombination protein RmuC [Candidatus Pelagibacter sp. TMED64]|nr:DNA recombination protein RmuC [Candidatus Pelagibacter sp.]OUU65001.1 MAG: DNA recombination protein RmuC [Candidatus Pelagibacter sp. TMED64]|tara:strand:- start:14118 stop:15158 length:1041 start_codon:yes stop_codon:yes gene_type:complete